MQSRASFLEMTITLRQCHSWGREHSDPCLYHCVQVPWPNSQNKQGVMSSLHSSTCLLALVLSHLAIQIQGSFFLARRCSRSLSRHCTRTLGWRQIRCIGSIDSRGHTLLPVATEHPCATDVTESPRLANAAFP